MIIPPITISDTNITNATIIIIPLVGIDALVCKLELLGEEGIYFLIA